MPIHISESQNTGYVASTDNETYVLDLLATIIAGASQDAFSFDVDTTGSTFVVDGVARGTTQFRSGISNSGTGNKVEISQSGVISGEYAIESNSGTLDITNHGFILAVGVGIFLHGNGGHVINTGHITSGGAGITVDGFGRDDLNQGRFTINNDGFIYGSGSAIITEAVSLTIKLGPTSELFSTAAAIISTGTGTTDVENLGFIRTTGTNAFIGSQTGADTFSNSGHVIGSIDLKGGDDTFTMNGGVVEGTVIGGRGDDTFIITKGNPTLRELAGEGDDTLRVAINHALGADNEFETIILTGKKKIAFTADASANDITGNRSNNVIDSGFGNDMITGGKGRDIFVHGTGGGLDTITDFTQGQDRLRIDIDGIDRFADLAITRQDRDVLIDMGNGDQFLIEHAKLGAFDKHDFLFG